MIDLTVVRGTKRSEDTDGADSDEEKEKREKRQKKSKKSKGSRSGKGKRRARKKDAREGSKKGIMSDEDSASSSGASSSSEEPDLGSDGDDFAAPVNKAANKNAGRFSAPISVSKRKLPGHQKIHGETQAPDSRDVHPAVKSLCFQLPSMGLSVLPSSWEKKNWDPESVGVFILCYIMMG